MALDFISLFSGIGCFEYALYKIFKDAKCVGFSDIDKNAIKCYTSHFNHSDVALGDIEKIIPCDLPNFDLLLAGFPCVSLSILRGKRQHLEGNGSRLFYDVLDIIEKKSPKYFVIENVASMSHDIRDKISAYLGCEPVLINSVEFTGQNRERYFWANFPISDAKTIEDKDWRHIKLNKWYPELEISEKVYSTLFLSNRRRQIEPRFRFFNSDDKYIKQILKGRAKDYLLAYSRSTRYPKGKTSYADHRVRIDRTANCLTGGSGCGSFSSKNFVMRGNNLRILHPVECERFQGLPDGWTDMISMTSRYKTIGKGLTTHSAEHIFKCLKNHIEGKL